MKWTLYKVDVLPSGDAKGDKTYYSNEKQNFTIDITDANFNITFSLTPSATVFSAAFKYFEIVMKPNFPLEKFQHQRSVMGLQEGANTIEELMKNAQVGDLPTKYYFDKENGLIHLKVAFRKNNKLFADSLTIVNTVKDWKNTQQDKWYIEVINATLIRKDEYAHQHSCGSKAFDCHKTECAIDPKDFVAGVSPWESANCIGSCGTCGVGYKCNASGLCAKIPSTNTRSSSNGLMIFMILFIMILMM